jgi:phosphatidylserine/phosphatidylglycerophosphate/cardiolipin synthase-like enzyme
MRFHSAVRLALPVGTLGALAVVAACAGAGKGSPDVVGYIPSFDSGVDGVTVTASSTPGGSSGPGSSGQNSSQTSTQPGQPDSGTSTSVVSSSSQSTPIQDSGNGQDTWVAPPPTNGIAITVIPDDTDAALLKALEGAQSSVHMTMYLLTNSTYINALASLKQKGRDVKVLLNQNFPSGTTTTNSGAYSTLTGYGVSVQWTPTTTGFPNYTHAKTIIIDEGTANAQVWIMTMNVDESSAKDNREYLAQDTIAADITEAEQIFEADWGTHDITAQGNLVIAPEPPNNAATALVNLVKSATSSIDMEAEEIDESGQDTEALLFAAIKAKASSGVTVHLVIQDSSDSSQTTAIKDLEAAGVKVMGHSCSGSTLDIHAKAIVADGARAYVGSENYTAGSLGDNREIGVIFAVASEVAKVKKAIDTDFADGTTYSASCSY